jgi:hypothetical protein
MKHFRGDLVRFASSSWGRNAMAWRIRDMFVFCVGVMMEFKSYIGLVVR